jgi:hypothetical protein
MANDPNVLEVRITNSENQTNYFLYVRKDRLEAFHNLLNGNRAPNTPAGMPGLSWGAMLGLDAIFEKRPRRFPVYDIVGYLAAESGASRPEVEKVLEKFAALYPPDITETA